MSTDADDLAAYGLAARILLAYDAGDHRQLVALLDRDPDAAVSALITLAGDLADQTYGGEVRNCLRSIATVAEIDAIGRQVTGPNRTTGEA